MACYNMYMVIIQVLLENTRTQQDCDKAATRLCTLNKVVTRLWQDGDKVVIIMFTMHMVVTRLCLDCFQPAR